MKPDLNSSHDPGLGSWVESANVPGTDFPIQNLPFGVFKRKGLNELPRVGVAIGDRVLDVTACRESGLFSGQAGEAAGACARPSLNPLMSLGSHLWSALRMRLSDLLSKDLPREKALVEPALIPMSDVDMLLPVEIGDYTDFYASIFHATNVGSMFRPTNPLLPKLQVRADRIPRPLLFDCPERYSGTETLWPDQGRSGRSTDVISGTAA